MANNKSVITFCDAVSIHRRLAKGECQHDIAADYGVNQGRISDIHNLKRFPGSWNVAFGNGRPALVVRPITMGKIGPIRIKAPSPIATV